MESKRLWRSRAAAEPNHATLLLILMVSSRLSAREQARLGAATEAVRKGMKLRLAERLFRVARSTIHRHARADQKNMSQASPSGRTPALAAAEEQVIVDLIQRYSDRGLPLTRTHVRDAFALYIARLPAARRSQMPFRDGRPGVKFLRNFTLRHKASLRFAKPLRQEGKRFAATSADALTTHCAALEKLIKELGVDPRRIWNLDETGATPGKDVNGASSSRRYLTRGGGGDMRTAEFAAISRITMMPVISAAGDSGPTLFVFKGTRLPYRNVARGGHVVAETYADYLPRDAVISTRADHGGVNADNFFQWATRFVAHIEDLTNGGRKVLLVLDAYRAHMTMRVLEYLDKNNVVVYALPAHTSGKTQPLDVVLFGSFKKHLNEGILLAARRDRVDRFDTFEFCALLRSAFYAAFTRKNIIASFRRSGICPFDASRLLSVALPRSAKNVAEIVSVQDLEDLYEERRRAVRTSILGADAQIASCGYLDTSNGLVLTSARAMELAREKAGRDREKRELKSIAELRRDVAAAKRHRMQRAEAERMRDIAWSSRARLAGMSVQDFRDRVRPLAQRRAVAKLRSAMRRSDC